MTTRGERLSKHIATWHPFQASWLNIWDKKWDLIWKIIDHMTKVCSTLTCTNSSAAFSCLINWQTFHHHHHLAGKKKQKRDDVSASNLCRTQREMRSSSQSSRVRMERVWRSEWKWILMALIDSRALFWLIFYTFFTSPVVGLRPSQSIENRSNWK